MTVHVKIKQPREVGSPVEIPLDAGIAPAEQGRMDDPFF